VQTNNGSVWAIENPQLWVSPATVISYGSWQTFFCGRGEEKRPKKEAPRTNKEKIPLQQMVLLSEQKQKGRNNGKPLVVLLFSSFCPPHCDDHVVGRQFFFALHSTKTCFSSV
jgi:hypothetical protein